MTKQVYRIDSNGVFIEPVMLNPNENGEYTIPSDCVETFVDGLFQPKWDGSQWIEGLTQSDIDTIKKNDVLQESLESTVSSLVYQLMMKGVI